LVEVGGGIDEGAARGGKEFAHDLVKGYVVGYAILEPVEVKQSGLVADAIVVVGADL